MLRRRQKQPKKKNKSGDALTQTCYLLQSPFSELKAKRNGFLKLGSREIAEW